MKKHWSSLSILLGILAFSAQAQWPTSPEQQLIVNAGGWENTIVSEGAGGAFVLISGCLLQKLDSYGYAFYSDPLYLPPIGQFPSPDHAAVTDGEGGIIFANAADDTSGGIWTETLNLFHFAGDGAEIFEYVEICTTHTTRYFMFL